jgi:flavin reductase (DIM6/NTAB) family NADH-FMN oxidoreductase RutF
MNESARPEIDAPLFRRVMASFVTGVTVITARDGEQPRGMTANAFMSGSLDPPLCVVSVAKRAHMHQALTRAGHFGVNILSETQERLSDHFAGRPDPTLAVRFEFFGEVPLLPGVCAQIAAEITARHDCGDHTLFIGHILFMEAADRPPLLYHAGRYGALDRRRVEHEAALPEFW